MIPIYSPYISDDALSFAKLALESRWFSSGHGYYPLAIEKLQEIFGYKYILLTSNGTTANHLMAKCCIKRFKSNTVIVPNNVYVAAWNPFLYDKKYNLYYYDCDIDTWNISLDYKINDGHSYICLLVHNLGSPINVPLLKQQYPDIIFVEDNCEGFGGKYNRKWTGTESIYSTLSFYANKLITSGEGGAFITNDEESYEYAKMLHGQGQSDEKYIHNYLGYNYRMTSIQAALLYGQLLEFDNILEKKRLLFFKYAKKLLDMPEVISQQTFPMCEPSYWMYAIRIVGNPGYKIAEKFFGDHGIEIRPMFYPIIKHHHLRNVAGNSIKNATILSNEVIMLPSYPDLTDDQLDYIAKAVRIYVHRMNKGELL